MKNPYGIIGCLLFVVAVAFSYFCNFPGTTVIEIAIAAFGLTSVIYGAVKKAKENNNFSWKTVVIIALACIAGCLCCIGGLKQNIFAEISAAALALLTIIFGIIFNK